MNKRIIALFSLYAAASLALMIRIGGINKNSASAQASGGQYSSYTVSQIRGYIYDRNMQPLVNTKHDAFVASAPTPETLGILKASLTNDEFEKAYEALSAGRPALIKTTASLVPSSGIVTLDAISRYSDSDPAQNIIGYLDSEGNGAFGLEKSFDSFLAENSGSLSVAFPVSASGRSLSGKDIKVKENNYNTRAGIAVTLDKSIQSACEKALASHNIETGCAVVLDVKDNAVLALATAPAIDRNNLTQSLEDKNSPFVNRALNAYSVGSVFKPIVAAAALDIGIDENTEFDCNGSVDVNSVTFGCHKKDGHGAVSMAQAVASSCNVYFINLGLKTGSEKILSLASDLGLGKEITLADGIVCKGGILPTKSDINSLPALANLSFGQGKLLSSPLGIAAVYAAFANGGIYREPYLVKCITDTDGKVSAYYKNETDSRVITESVCKKIQRMLTLTVTDGSGKNACPENTTAAGKTATAQSGWYENGQEVLHTWFAGWFPAEEPRYVITVMNERGSSSSTDCAPVFKTIADSIYAYELKTAKEKIS